MINNIGIKQTYLPSIGSIMPSLNHKIAGTGSPMAIHGNVIGCLSMVSRAVGKLLISVGGTAK